MMVSTECIFCGAGGPFDPHLIDPVCDRCLVSDLLSRYAAACDALDFAHSEGFEWPVDPFSSTAIAFADPECAWDHIAQGIEAAPAAKTATEIGGLVHESPVAESDAPNSNGPSPEGFVR